MAIDGSDDKLLAPTTISALKNDAAAVSRHARTQMERSFSQDIQEGSRELKEAAEQTRNIILDLGLDGVIRWVSPSWTDVVGTQLEAVKGHPISKFIVDKPDAFTEAIKSLKNDDSKSQFVKFAIKVGVISDLEPMLTSEQKAEAEGDKSTLELEGQGIMVYDRTSGGESHTMWMLQPAAEPVQITIALPRFLVESLGVGAELLAKYLTELAENGANDPANHPPPLPVLCRVCERTIVPWWFEKHSDLCVQEHRAEMDVQLAQESLIEHRHAIVKVLDAFEARKQRNTSGDSAPVIVPPPEYKGMPIGPTSTPSSGMSSTPTSNPGTPMRSRSPSATSLGHNRGRSFAVRRPLARIVELILDLCDTAIEISTPAIKETKNEPGEEFRTQSPQSESRISQIVQWQTPSSLDQEQGLTALSVDTEKLARAKIEAVHRHRTIIEYAERIRQEYLAEVDACITEALRKAEKVAAGEELSCSSASASESEDERLADVQEEEATSPAPVPAMPISQSSGDISSMAAASRSTSDVLSHDHALPRRASSVAISTRSSSPLECPTPRSHKSGILGQSQPTTMRSSMYLESDANDSDSSLLSSGVFGTWRTESPSTEQTLSRAASSRDRKRRSLHLHGLNSGSPRRQQSPGRAPQPLPSPLRMSKPRVPSAEGQSPIVSPLLTTGEFMSPYAHPPHHHRRQSSVHSTDVKPPSPKVGSISQPPQRAQPPSIKDFEIIKPISKGAFGSVYLSKKKLTGDYFAIKVLRKADMVAKNQVTNVKAERAIMMWQGESDFVAKLYWTFSSKDYLYLVMEYLNGGDCASLIKILGGLPEDWAKKYIAEVILGVEHLHSRGIVHRDLKPDNLLIDHKGHLKLTDFGLSRMGLVGRQKRLLKDMPESAPDLLKQGPFVRAQSTASSRSASFDYQGSHSPNQTPLMTPALAGGLDQPSYFSLSRENTLSRQPSRKTSGHRSESGNVSVHDLHHAFKSFSLYDPGDMHSLPNVPRSSTIEEGSHSHGSNSPDLFPLQPVGSNVSQPPSGPTTSMLPPPMALFDPEDSTRRFVGTPDYLAPETINGSGQDEMSDWWSIGCILFEFLFGYPPFNADTPEKVFEKILARDIAWPEESEVPTSEEAKDLFNKLTELDPRDRIGANTSDKYSSSAEEIKGHPWFSDINWETLLDDEAQFVPNPENPEDTEYFDARGATLQSFPEELEEQLSPRMTTPGGTEIGERPHDALGRVRHQVNTLKRGLMPLHIPRHVARDTRSRRLSEPAIADDFGNFTYKNLPILEKANKDIVNKMRAEAMQAQARAATSTAVTTSNTPVTSSPGPSLEGSPLLPGPLKRTLSVNKGLRSASPSGLAGSSSSPHRPSQPSSPLLVQFSTGQNHERRKTSGSSQSSTSLQPGSFFDLARDGNAKMPSAASSPIKNARLPAISPAKVPSVPRQSSMPNRVRSQTVGSQEGPESPREHFIPSHHKRRSQLFVQDISPSSSDNEGPHSKALYKVQRRRQSSRRLSQINLADGPIYRPLDVLICEDHPVSKLVMERLFEKLRCRTITASTGSEAIRLAVSEIQFDIIFMEYKLPVINGADVARMIRDTKNANTHTPIVAVTGYLKELPEVHNFDTLIQKPPTMTKLTEALCKFCSWKPPAKDFKPTMPLSIPPSNLRQETPAMQDSPTSTASTVPTMPDSSWKGSSREDSISSSSFFGDVDSVKGEPAAVVVRRPTEDWSIKGGLGISEEIVTEKQPYIMSGFPHLVHTESAPASQNLDFQPPQRQKSQDRPKIIRTSQDKQRYELGAESGDDEDEELGNVQVRARSPQAKQMRQASKLGHEMMRTNSRGSVISTVEDGKASDIEISRPSMEILEQRMAQLKIPEELEATTPLEGTPPRKLERTGSYHAHPDPAPLPEGGGLPSTGHITPPVIFPKQCGAEVKEFDMDASGDGDGDVTPMPKRTINLEGGPTPRPQGSPSQHIM